MQNTKKNKPFQEVAGGEYDPYGFYYTPNGSFWDPDGVHFSAEGFDAHGGFYDEKLEYIPGAGWITELLCYEDEKDSVLNSLKPGGQHTPLGLLPEAADEEDLFDEEGDVDEIYEDIDYDKLIREEEKGINFNRSGAGKDQDKDFHGEVLGLGGDKVKEQDLLDEGASKVRKVFNPRNAAQAHFNNMINLANDVNSLSLKNEGNKSNNNYNTNFDNNHNNNNFNYCRSGNAYNDNREKKTIEEEKEKPVITPDMLFNKIPENLKPKNTAEYKSGNIGEQVKEGVVKKETKIEVDSLFG